MPKASDRKKKRTNNPSLTNDTFSVSSTVPSSSSSATNYGTSAAVVDSSSSSSSVAPSPSSLHQMDITEYNSSSSSIDNRTEEPNDVSSSSSSSSTVTGITTSYRSSSSVSSTTKFTTVDEEIEIIGFGRYQFFAILILGLANAADAIELLCASFILPQLPDFTDFDKSFLSSAIFIGMLIGGLFFGIASDFLGRKLMLIIALLINAVFGALSALAPTQPYTLLILCRIVAGFGVGGSIPGVFTLTVEILPIKNRGFWLSVVAWWWMIGSIYGAGMAWLMIGTLQLSWRYFALVCALPAFLGAFLIMVFLYESPRYLSLNHNLHGAEQVLNNIALWNKSDTRLAKGYRLVKNSTETDNEEANEEKHVPSFPTYKDTETLSKTASKDTPSRTTKTSLKNFVTPSTANTNPNSNPSSSAFVIDDGDDEEDDTNDISANRSTPSSSTASTPRNVVSEHDTNENDDSSFVPVDEEQGLLRPRSSKAMDSPASSSSSSSYTRKQQIFYINRCCFCSRNGKLGRQILYTEIRRPLGAFFSPSIRRTSILLMVIWFTLSLGWYGLTLWIPTIFHESNVQLDEYQDAFLVQAANLPGNIVSAVLMDRLGRKGVLISSLILAGIAAISFPFTNSEVTTVLCACLLNAASTCTWNALDCLSTESFPTALRTTSMGVLAASGRIGSIIGQFIFGALIHVSLFALLGVAGGVLVCGSIAGFLLPKEPKGKKLDETT